MKDLSIGSTNHNSLKHSSKNWIFIALSIIFLQIFLLTFIYCQQKNQLAKMLHEISTLETFIENQQPILDAKTKLNKDYQDLIIKKTNLISNTKLPKLILKKISKSIPLDTRISTIFVKNNTISIKGISKTWISLNNFYDNLSNATLLGTTKLKNSKKESDYLNFEIEIQTNKKAKT